MDGNVKMACRQKKVENIFIFLLFHVANLVPEVPESEISSQYGESNS